jgi:hypothetical protein
MKRTKYFISAALAAFALMFLMVFSASASTATFPTFTLSSSSTQLNYALPEGTEFDGSILTTGPIRFFVSAPNGFVIVNLGIVDEAGKFNFTSQETGNYTLTFENALPNSVQVTFSYMTNPDISIDNNSAGLPFIYLPIFIIIAVFGSIFIIFLVRHRNKKQNSLSYTADQK